MFEAFDVFMTALFDESGGLMVMFVVTGLAFNVFTETIKKQIWPKYTAEELAAGKVQKEMPAWIGMIFGIVMTAIFTACAVLSSAYAVPHCQLIGGNFFVPVWMVAYYLWQMACMKVIKGIMTALFPRFMTGHKRPQKPQRPKVYKVPAGATVEYVQEDGEVNG